MHLLKRIAQQLHAVLSVCVLALTTSIAFIPVLFIGLLKLLPNQRLKQLCTNAVDRIATIWCGVNNFYFNKIQRIKLNVRGLENLNTKQWYLVVANHQSWLDIVVLQRLFNRKIPTLKFFIKDQLKWVPLLGFAWWAMGCPFMKRYSADYLAKNPHKKGQDLISTRKAIDSFKETPVSIMNFLEGTRFTLIKKQQQQSPYTHLLKPRAGGISFIISAMGQHISSLMDVTIVYPEKKHSLWDYLCRRVKSAQVLIRQIPIPSKFMSSKLVENSQVLNEFKEWLNQQWAEKDQLISTLK